MKISHEAIDIIARALYSQANNTDDIGVDKWKDLSKSERRPYMRIAKAVTKSIAPIVRESVIDELTNHARWLLKRTAKYASRMATREQIIDLKEDNAGLAFELQTAALWLRDRNDSYVHIDFSPKF